MVKKVRSGRYDVFAKSAVMKSAATAEPGMIADLGSV
jgi:hypothetical protein